MSRARWVRMALDVVGVGLIVLYVGGFVTRNVSIQGDFRTYVTAARAASMHLDPYQPRTLTALAGRPVEPFLYPPITLLAFLPLTALPPSTAAAFWIGLKVALLAACVLIWLRWFVPEVGLLSLVLIAVFGWNGAALWDLNTGNVALVECGMVWAALACFANGRRTAFAALVVAGACFKLLPVLFLLLLLVPTERNAPSPRRLLIWTLVFAANVFGPMAMGPASHWQSFLRHLPDARTLGQSNPGILGLASALAASAGIGEPSASRVATWGWGVYLLAMLAISVPFLRRAWRRRDPRVWAVAALFLFVMMEPRPMAYGFVLLAPAPVFFAPRMFRRPAGGLLLALLIAAQGLSRAAHHESPSWLYTYSPALLTSLLWLLILESESRDAAPRLPAYSALSARASG